LLKEEVHDLCYNSLKELIFYLVGSKLFFGMWGQIMHTLGGKPAASGSEQRTSVWQEG
jgi:hypothetical protein